ncbi:hypothetical protein D1007_27839 [Hordeum vulgare]|nr:hypothetical protein D1007_27839 [Hordeum vulgare]
MNLNRQYHNLKQGDFSISEYARRMKLLTAGLTDIDYPVTEVDLTTQFLHDIDKRLDTIHVVLGDTVPLPPFVSRIKLAKENLSHREADDSATILAVTVAPSWHGGPAPGSSSGPGNSSAPRYSDRIDRGHGPPPGRGHGNRQDSGDRNRGRGRGRGRGRDDHGARGAPLQLPYNPYMGFFAPYGTAIPSPRPG